MPLVLYGSSCLPVPFWEKVVIPSQKIIVHFLAPLTGFHGIFQFFIGAEIVGLAFEGDLCDPPSVLFVLANAFVFAGVAAPLAFLVRLQNGHGGSVYQFQIFLDDLILQTATAFRFARLQKGLTDYSFVSTVAPASPDNPAGLSSFCWGTDQQFSEPPSGQVIGSG